MKTDFDFSHISTGNGVSIGLAEDDFVKKFGVDFKRSGSSLTYEEESQRKATKEESAELHQLYPSELEFNFDVIVTVRAKFDKNGLSDYYLRKVESL